MLFCLLEIAINAMEHVPSMPILLLGRVLGGISTSLLFSAFESWMVAEHRRRGFPEAWLAKTFGLSQCRERGGCCCCWVTSSSRGGYQRGHRSFQLAIALTVLALVLILRWPENYGKKSRAC